MALTLRTIGINALHGSPRVRSLALVGEVDSDTTAYVEKAQQPYSRSVVHQGGIVRYCYRQISDLEAYL